MQLDPAEFLPHVEGLAMSHAAKIELIETVLRIADAFVDLAWGTSPEQTALWISGTNSTDPAADPLSSADTLAQPFNDAAQAAEESYP